MKALIAQKFVGKKPQKKAKPQIHTIPLQTFVIICQTVARCLTNVNQVVKSAWLFICICTRNFFHFRRYKNLCSKSLIGV